MHRPPSMARITMKFSRMCGIRWSRKHTLITWLFICCILVYKLVVFLRAPPQLYQTALRSIKEDDILTEYSGDADCRRRVINVNSYVVVLRDVTVDPTKTVSTTSSGVVLNEGFFTITCNGEFPLVNFLFHASLSHFPQWASSVRMSAPSNLRDNDIDLVEGYTIAVKRRTPTNAYYMILDIYNAYVTLKLIGQNPDESLILFLDGYKEETTDILWSIVFSEISQLIDINKKRVYEHIVWAIPHALGAFETRDIPYPYLEDFNNHLVTKSGASSKVSINCKYLQITLLTGSGESGSDGHGSGGSAYSSQHGLANADDVAKRLRDKFPQFETIVIEPNGSVLKQMQIYAMTDVLIAVHGDEFQLANALLLRQGAGLIELFPTWYRISSDNRFRELAEMRHVRYNNWYNNGFSFTDMRSMVVDPDIIISLVDQMKLSLCSG